jgi:micrococcal nuclease
MHEYNCTIRRVVDGDTVDVDIDLGFGMWIHNERVRLYGIDTPESRTRDLEEKKAGLFAKDVVLHYLPEGSKQVLKTHKDKVGKYGRVLGEFIMYDAENDCQTTINKFMIDHRIGVEYSGKSKEEIKQQHIDNRKYLEEKDMFNFFLSTG